MVNKLRSCSNTPTGQHQSAHRWHHSHGDGEHSLSHSHSHSHGSTQSQEQEIKASARSHKTTRKEKTTVREMHSTSSSVSTNSSCVFAHTSQINDSFLPHDYDLLTYTLAGSGDNYPAPNMSRHSLHSDSEESFHVTNRSHHVDRSVHMDRSSHVTNDHVRHTTRSDSTDGVRNSPLRRTTRSMSRTNSPNVSSVHRSHLLQRHNQSRTGTANSAHHLSSANDRLDLSHVSNSSRIHDSSAAQYRNLNGGGMNHRKYKDSLVNSLFGPDTEDEDEDLEYVSRAVDSDVTMTSSSSLYSITTLVSNACQRFFGPAYDAFMFYIGGYFYDIISHLIIMDVWLLLRTGSRRSCPFLILLFLLLPLLLLGVLPALRGMSTSNIFARYHTNTKTTEPTSRPAVVAGGTGEARTGALPCPCPKPEVDQAKLDAMFDARLADVSIRLAQMENQILERESKLKVDMDSHVQSMVGRLFADKWQEAELRRPPPPPVTPAAPAPPPDPVTVRETVIREVGLSKDDVMAIVRDVIGAEMTSFQTVRREMNQEIKVQIDNVHQSSEQHNSVISGLEAKLKILEDAFAKNSDHLSTLQALFAQYNSSVTRETMFTLIHQTVLEEVTSQMKSHVVVPPRREEKTVKQTTTVLSHEQLVQIRALVMELFPGKKADGTDLPDYALESLGGSILSTRCTETYRLNTAMVSLFGIPLYYIYNSPRMVIQPDVQPGNCWPFRGSEGHVVIQLSGTIIPSSFTVEHIPKTLSPTGTIDSAPRRFTVWGLQTEKEERGRLLGNYTYDANGPPLQTFLIQDPDPRATPMVEVKIHSNHGNPEYTCLYRVRVHGSLTHY